MKTRRRIFMAVGLILVLAVLPNTAASAQTVESSLNAWSLEGQLLIEGSESKVTARRSFPCGAIRDAITMYNAAEQWLKDETYIGPIRYIGTSVIQFESLSRYFASPEGEGTTFDYVKTVLDFCTQIQTDGWLAATADVLARAEGGGSGWVTITQVGPLACTTPGQLLMVRSSYNYTAGGWVSAYGTGFTEDLSKGTPNYAGTFEMVCMDLVPGGGSDFLNASDLVPTAQVNHNPLIKGLTGLDTWLWYDFTAPDSYLLELTVNHPSRGTFWDLVMFAWVDKVSWDIDCETACDYRGTEAGFDASGYEYTLDLPDSYDLSSPAVLAPATVYDGGAGSDNDAAATHKYRTKGDYVISTATIWRGYYEFDGIIYPYIPVVVADSVDYQVIEVRSRLITPVP